MKYHIEGLVQERHNSIASALELHLSCIYPLIYININSVWKTADIIIFSNSYVQHILHNIMMHLFLRRLFLIKVLKIDI